jgi:hypothetical protein
MTWLSRWESHCPSATTLPFLDRTGTCLAMTSPMVGPVEATMTSDDSSGHFLWLILHPHDVGWRVTLVWANIIFSIIKEMVSRITIMKFCFFVLLCLNQSIEPIHSDSNPNLNRVLFFLNFYILGTVCTIFNGSDMSISSDTSVVTFSISLSKCLWSSDIL